MPTSFAVDTSVTFIGALEQYLTNAVGDTVYYGTQEDVSSVSNDGFLDPGDNVRLTGTPTWITSAGSSTVMTAVIEHAEDTTNVHGITDTADLAGGGVAPDLTNMPSTTEKAALTGTSGTASGTNKYVTDADSRNTNARTPSDASVTIAKVATSLKPSGTAATTDESLRKLGTTAGTAAAGDDSRITAALQPTAYTTTGDVLYASSANTPTRRAIGTAGQVLTVSGGLPTWAAPASAGAYLGTFDASGGGHGSPAITDGSGTTGDFYVVSVAGTVNPNGGAFSVVPGDQVRYSGTVWQKIATGGASGVSTITTATQSGVSGAVTINSAADVGLGNVTNFAQIEKRFVDAKGDLLTATANDTPARLPVSVTNGFILVADSSTTTGLKWAAANGDTIFDIRDFGAVTGTAVGAATTTNTAAINDAFAAAAGGAVTIPLGTFNVNGSITVPSNTDVLLYGIIKANAAIAGPIFRFRTPGPARGVGGGLHGYGSIKCNALADYAIEFDSWHAATIESIEVNNPVIAALRLYPAQGSDLDFMTVRNLNMVHSGDCAAAVADPSLRPPRFIVCDATPGRITDSRFDLCHATGFYPDADRTGVNGSWGIELIDCQRLTFEKTYIGDNTRPMAGSVLVRNPGTALDCEGIVLRDHYIESQPGTVAGSFPAASCTRTATSTTVTIVNHSDTLQIFRDLKVSGTGIPANTVVSSVNYTANTMVISNAATASGTSNLTFGNPGYQAIKFIQEAGGTKLSQYHLIDALRVNTNAAAADSQRLVLVNNTGVAGRLGQIIYRNPRNTISAGGQISVGGNVATAIIEVLGTTGGEGSNVTGAGTFRVHGLMSGGSTTAVGNGY